MLSAVWIAAAAALATQGAAPSNTGWCRFAARLEGTVLLEGAKCCDGEVIDGDEACAADSVNEDVSYSTSAPHLLECDMNSASAVIIARSAEDVSAAIRYVKRRGLEFRVRSGGHSQSCASACNNCVVISLEAMKTIEYIQPDGDQGPTYMAVEPGNTLLDLFENYLANGNVYFPHGQDAPVGLGGHLGGGGVGMLTRKFGLGTDFIVGVQIVLASGRVLEVFDEEHEVALAGHRRWQNKKNQDLLWAIRGNGHASFGVITKYWMRTIPRATYMVIGYYQYRLTAESAHAFWNGSCSYYTSVNETQKSRNLVAWPLIQNTGGPVLYLTIFYTPDDNSTAQGALAEAADEIARYLEPITAELLFSAVAPVPSAGQLTGMSTSRTSYTCTSRVVWNREDACEDDDWRDGFASRVFEESQEATVASSFFTYFDPWGGAARENDPLYKRTSFMARHAWGVVVYCRLPPAEVVTYDAATYDLLFERIDDFNATVLANISNAWYTNFQDRTTTQREHIYPVSSVYQKLRQVKAIYDADNFFNDRLSVELPDASDWE